MRIRLQIAWKQKVPFLTRHACSVGTEFLPPYRLQIASDELLEEGGVERVRATAVAYAASPARRTVE
jgi:hypothetical protein